MDHFTFDHLDNKPDSLAEAFAKSDPNWVLTQGRPLMSSYRKTDYQNPEGFIATLGSDPGGISAGDRGIRDRPEDGLQRRCKWPPTPAEVVEACAAEIGWRTKIAQNSGLSPVPKLPPPIQRRGSDEMIVQKIRPAELGR